MDGGDRAGYKQISKNVDAIIISSTSGATTGRWTGLEVLTTQAVFVGITAAGISNSSLITSATSYPQGTKIRGGSNGITAITMYGTATNSTKATVTESTHNYKAIAYVQTVY